MVSNNPVESIDAANRRAMRRPDTVEEYSRADYLDAGEKALYDSIASAANGKPVLDIGVGGGRTIRALTSISGDYTAIDYTPEMLDALKLRHPLLRLLCVDARDMSVFADGSIYLAVFSCAGIDMVDATDRMRILREIRRVLSPGGAFIFSTHNLEFRMRQREPTFLDIAFPPQGTRNPFKRVWRAMRALPSAPVRLRSYRALKGLSERHEDWAILNSQYHQYGTLMHYITLSAQRAQLEAAGFEPGIVAYSSEGELLSNDTARCFMLHLMARVPVR